MNIVITISGLHGTGKSTYARAISKEFNLRHVSAGSMFRQMALERGTSIEELSRAAEQEVDIDRVIDERTREEASKGGVVLDGLLAGWMARDKADVRIYLRCPDDVRIRRIAERDGISYERAKERTILREAIERRRFKRLYDIEMDDLSIYDLIVNTGLLPLKSNVEVINKFVREYISSRGVER